jgi:hypothetical protein
VNLFICSKTSNLIISHVSRVYVGLINCLNTSNLFILFLPVHPSAESRWTWSFVWTSLIWSFYPILFNRLQEVRELGQLLNTSHLIIPFLPLHPPGCTWTLSVVWIPLIWSHPIPFLRLQMVRGLGQVSQGLYSHHAIPSTLLIQAVRQLFEYLSSDHLIATSLVCTWTWSIVLRPLVLSCYPILFIRLQAVRQLSQLFEYL